MCDFICNFLIVKLNKEIEKMKKYNQDSANIFSILMRLVAVKDFEKSGDKINELFENKTTFKMKSNFAKLFVSNHLPTSSFLKIGFLIMLSFASFMLNFHHIKSVKYSSEKVSADYDKNQDTQKSLQENQNLVKSDKINDSTSEFDLNQ